MSDKKEIKLMGNPIQDSKYGVKHVCSTDGQEVTTEEVDRCVEEAIQEHGPEIKKRFEEINKEVKENELESCAIKFFQIFSKKDDYVNFYDFIKEFYENPWACRDETFSFKIGKYIIEARYCSGGIIMNRDVEIFIEADSKFRIFHWYYGPFYKSDIEILDYSLTDKIKEIFEKIQEDYQIYTKKAEIVKMRVIDLAKNGTIYNS